jgi:hypothetical protein
VCIVTREWSGFTRAVAHVVQDPSMRVVGLTALFLMTCHLTLSSFFWSELMPLPGGSPGARAPVLYPWIPECSPLLHLWTPWWPPCPVEGS